MEFTETEHRREEHTDLPVSLLMVLHALQLECRKSMELTAFSHRFCLSVRVVRVVMKWLSQSQSPLGLGGRSGEGSRIRCPSSSASPDRCRQKLRASVAL